MADLYVKAGFGPSGRFVLQGGEYIDPDGRGKANIAALRVYARRQIVQRLVLICSEVISASSASTVKVRVHVLISSSSSN